MESNKLIKSVATTRYTVEIREVSHGFQINYESEYSKPTKSELIFDYKTADYLFELKLTELEGN